VRAHHVSKFDFGEIAKFSPCNSKTLKLLLGWENVFFPSNCLIKARILMQQKKSGKGRQPGQKLRAFEINSKK